MDDGEMQKSMVAGAWVVRGRDWCYGAEDGNPRGMGMIVNTFFLTQNNSYDVQVQWKSGKTSLYRMGTIGIYDLKPVSFKKHEQPFAIRTWRHSDLRFFATPFLGKDDFWHISCMWGEYSY